MSTIQHRASSGAAQGDAIGPFANAAELESAITTLSEGMRALSRSRLKRDTIVLLLHDMTRIGKRDIVYILNGLEQLESHYLKPAAKR